MRSYSVKENHFGSAVSEILRKTGDIMLLYNKDSVNNFFGTMREFFFFYFGCFFEGTHSHALACNIFCLCVSVCECAFVWAVRLRGNISQRVGGKDTHVQSK